MKKLALLTLAFLMSLSTSQVLAHPHVWVTARAELVFDENRQFTAVKNIWQFDEGFSAYASQGLDENGDGQLSREELQELAQVNMDSLKDFEYFVFVQMGEQDPVYDTPKDYWLEHKDGTLTLHFTLPMKTAVAADPKTGFRDLTVEIFDPTFFVDIGFVKENAVQLNGAEGCRLSFQKAKELDPFQSLLLSEIGPEENVPEDIAPAEGDLANTIRVNCGDA